MLGSVQTLLALHHRFRHKEVNRPMLQESSKQHTPPTMAEARRQLHEALAEEKRLRAAHDECVAASRRVRDLIAAVGPAEDAAEDAAAAASAAMKRWAISGVRAGVPTGNQALSDAAAEAQ
jgi:hypothetical protein